jgi:toxin HigB-1
MIESFRNNWLETFFVNDDSNKNIPANLESSLFRKLQLIDDSTTDADLRIPPGNRFEKLSANLDGFHAIRVNQQWRLIFIWDADRGVATDAYLDNHSYR